MEKTLLSDFVLGTATTVVIGGICAWADRRHRRDQLYIEMQNNVIKFQNEVIKDLLKDKKKKTEA